MTPDEVIPTFERLVEEAIGMLNNSPWAGTPFHRGAMGVICDAVIPPEFQYDIIVRMDGNYNIALLGYTPKLEDITNVN